MSRHHRAPPLVLIPGAGRGRRWHVARADAHLRLEESRCARLQNLAPGGLFTSRPGAAEARAAIARTRRAPQAGNRPTHHARHDARFRAGDTLDEEDETFTLDLSTALNATISDGQGQGTITDDDPLPALSVGELTVTEGDSSTRTATFRVTLSPPSGRTVTVSYATEGQTATAGADFTAASGH